MFIFFFQAEDGIRAGHVTGVQTCALPIFLLIIVGGTGLGVLIGQLAGYPIYIPVLVFTFTLLGAMFLLSRWAEGVAYERIEGRPGAVGSALGTIRRGWNI